MSRITALLTAAVLTLAPASVFACAMERITLPDPIEVQVEENDSNQLAALMGEIDAVLEDSKAEARSDTDARKSDAAAAADAVETKSVTKADKAS